MKKVDKDEKKLEGKVHVNLPIEWDRQLQIHATKRGMFKSVLARAWIIERLEKEATNKHESQD